MEHYTKKQSYSSIVVLLSIFGGILIGLCFGLGYGESHPDHSTRDKQIVDSTRLAKIIELQKSQIYDQQNYFKKLTDSISTAKLEYNASKYYKKPSK